MRATLLAIALVLSGVSACGEDPPPPPASKPGGGGARGGAKKGPAKKGKPLKPMVRIEDRVECPTPTDAKKCNPKAPTCGDDQYCLAAGKEHYCGPCPERDAIRPDFKMRDFQVADARDPFQSFVIIQPGLGTGGDSQMAREQTPKCTRKDQFVATNYNYQSLKLVGIVTRGAQRKALMMGGNLGYFVKRGDCVGKEKAIVKDIGAGFVNFQLEGTGQAPGAEFPMYLYPTQVSMTTPDVIDPNAGGTTPIVAPPSGSAPQAPGPQDEGGTTTTIVQPPRPQQQQQQAPQQAPTTINP